MSETNSFDELVPAEQNGGGRLRRSGTQSVKDCQEVDLGCLESLRREYAEICERLVGEVMRSRDERHAELIARIRSGFERNSDAPKQGTESERHQGVAGGPHHG